MHINERSPINIWGKGENMKIQSISCNYDCKRVNHQQPNFNGIFMRVGTGNKTLMPNFYSNVAYIPFKDGNKELLQRTYKDKPIWVFPECSVTAIESKAAYKFLFEKIQNSETYKAALKLKQYVESLSSDGEHNTMYIEKEDIGKPATANWSKLELSQIISKLNKYESDKGIKKTVSDESSKPQKMFTIDELWEMLHRNGVA